MKNLLFFLFAMILILPANADDDKEYLLRKKIAEAKKKIEEFKKKKKELDNKITESRDSHSKRMERRKNDITKISSDISELGIELKGKKSEKRRLERAEKNYQAQFALFRNKLKTLMSDYSYEVTEDIPYNTKDRMANLKRLITDAEFDNISEEELFNRFNIFLKKETLLGLDSEVFVRDNVKYLRIGWLIMAYSNESGEDTGVLTRKNGKWTWDNELDFEMRKAVRDSIKMVEGKKAPDIKLFPVPMPVVNEFMKGAEK